MTRLDIVAAVALAATVLPDTPARAGTFDHQYAAYDWSLNDVAAEVESSAPGCAMAETRGVRSSVRSPDADIMALLIEGCRRSPTLQRLIDEIGRTNGIVYIQAGSCPSRRLRGCLLHLISNTGNARYMWIRINPDVESAELVPTIAHELRHALEVLEQRWIRSRWDVLQFYRSFEARALGGAPPDGPFQTYETAAAIDAGAAVRSELAALSGVNLDVRD